MRVLVTGAAGQVGREIVRLAATMDADVVGRTRAELDITDADAVRQAVASSRADAVINAAAYTAVDRAEDEPDTAFAVNRDGPRHLAAACRQRGVPLVHLSTDYVFDGTQTGVYAPDDPVSPLNVYGASKAAGEDAIRETWERHVIIRTAWVFSRFDGNFVSTMWRLAGERDRLAVVDDQWGHPTAAADVARVALVAARRALDDVTGTFHVAGAELATWRDLAVAALDSARRAVPSIPVDPISTAEYPTPAVRPRRVELAMGDSLDQLGVAPLDWRSALQNEADTRF